MFRLNQIQAKVRTPNIESVRPPQLKTVSGRFLLISRGRSLPLYSQELR